MAPAKYYPILSFISYIHLTTLVAKQFALWVLDEEIPGSTSDRLVLPGLNPEH